MLSIFPNLKEEMMKMLDEEEQLLMHIVFGQVFNNYIRKVFTNTSSTIKEKIKIANFLEQMAISESIEVKAVLTDTVIEELLDIPEEFIMIEPYLCSKTVSYLPLIKSYCSGSTREQIN